MAGAIADDAGLNPHRALDDVLRHVAAIHAFDLVGLAGEERERKRAMIVRELVLMKAKLLKEWGDRLALAMGEDVLARHRAAFDALSTR